MPFSQSTYQVRFEWGVEGLARLNPADIVVVVDVLSFSTRVILALEAGQNTAMDATAHAVSINGAPLCDAAAPTGATVLLGGLRNAAAVARAVLAVQTERGTRTSVAVIAAGERTGRDPHAPVRFAVEDQLGAGAIISALTDLGIDHCSPEAAATAESFRALRRASKHLLTSSGSGRELAERDDADRVALAAAVDAASVVPVLRNGTFVAF
jgi:2-phosphosulfolactate phosphatase